MIRNVYQSETAGWQVWRSTSTTAATTSPPAVVLHTGGGVLPVLAYYTASGGREAARRGAGQVRHLGQQQQPGLLLSSLSLSPPSVLCACLVRVHLSGSPAGFCFLATPPRLVYLCSPPIHEAGPRRGRELSTTSAGSPPC